MMGRVKGSHYGEEGERTAAAGGIKD
jgi:hypothetical protein